MSAQPQSPTATYRFQLTPDFGFADVEAQIPYLKKLGISHVYLSPISQPVAGSEHGYDVIDYNTINPELGGEDKFRHMAQALKDNGLKMIVDWVPNHMGIEKNQNPWWQDVMKNGRTSVHASKFDIFWDEHPQKKLVVPTLGGELSNLMKDYCRIPMTGVHRTDRSVTSEARTTGHDTGRETSPDISPHEYNYVINVNDKRVSYTYDQLDPQFRVVQDAETKEYSFDYWGKPFPINEEGQKILQQHGASLSLIEINHQPKLLEQVMEQQHYAPIFWQEGLEKINYRRFFNINDLAGMRVEDPQVFQAMHGKLQELVQDGLIQGIRLDHIDGLRDPEKYLHDLRNIVGPETYVVGEKILAPDEKLPSSWPVQGTTGYDMLNPLNNLYAKDSKALTELYSQMLGEPAPDYEELLRKSRIAMMEGELKPELRRLADRLSGLADGEGFTNNPHVLTKALEEITAAFPTYRTYSTENSELREEDRKIIDQVVFSARTHATTAAVKRIIAFIGDVLKQEVDTESKDAAKEFTLRFQQFAGPVIATGTENTAFYRYFKLAAMNEVGGEPNHIGISPKELLALAASRAASTMNTFTTHDTKRSEDTRARGAALSHIPEKWAAEVSAWKQHFTEVKDAAKPISGNDEYLVYQTLVSTLPLKTLFAEPGQPLIDPAYREELSGYALKAIKEAKLLTSWVPSAHKDLANPDSAYEDSVKNFITAILKDESYLKEKIIPFTTKVARVGANVSLQQRVLQTTLPGVPDIYQGSEIWKLTTVDPYNRVTPDFEKLSSQLERASNLTWETLTEHWQDGQIKQVLTSKMLQLRQDNPALFGSNQPGELVPLKVYGPEGEARDDVLAFARRHTATDGKEQAVVIAVPVELNDTLFNQKGAALGYSTRFDNIRLELPDELRNASFADVLRGNETVNPEKDSIVLKEGFRHVPAAVIGSNLTSRTR